MDSTCKRQQDWKQNATEVQNRQNAQWEHVSSSQNYQLEKENIAIRKIKLGSIWEDTDLEYTSNGGSVEQIWHCLILGCR